MNGFFAEAEIETVLFETLNKNSSALYTGIKLKKLFLILFHFFVRESLVIGASEITYILVRVVKY